MGGPSTNFFQKLIQIHKMWLKLAKIGSFRTITFKNETFEKKCSGVSKTSYGF
jgi:hypothetical protein